MPAGRPTELNDDVRRKIEEAAAIGASIEEIAFYAGVHRATLYRWMEADQELRDRIDELREKPILKARQTVVNSLDDPGNAFRYLERKKAKEFAPSQKIEHAGEIKTTPTDTDPSKAAALAAAARAYEDARRADLTGTATKPDTTPQKPTNCPKCGLPTEGHERDGSQLCWCKDEITGQAPPV